MRHIEPVRDYLLLFCPYQPITAMKRCGTWKRDINLELVDPFTQTIAQSFSKMFKEDLFGPFETDVVNCVAQLLQDFLNSTAPELKPGAMLQQKAARKELRATLSRTMEAVKETMLAQRKEISRSVSPLIQKCLMESYENAKREKGKGSVARIKVSGHCSSNERHAHAIDIWQTHFRAYVEQRKDSMFEEAADTILLGLDNATKAIGDALKGTLSQLAEKVIDSSCEATILCLIACSIGRSESCSHLGGHPKWRRADCCSCRRLGCYVYDEDSSKAVAEGRRRQR